MESVRKWFTTLSLVVLALFLLIQRGLAIRCFICNTHLHFDDCRNLPEATRGLYMFDCNLLAGNKTYTKCRKMHQDFGTEIRVIRQCAVTGDNECVFRSGTKRVRMKYCQCDTDLCNHAPGTAPPHLPALLSLSIAALLLPRVYQQLRD